MEAMVRYKYGSPDLLGLEEVQEPIPRDDEVLIRVHASSVNDWDWGLLHGTPFANRALYGLFKPRRRILGSDIAGRVEAVGGSVTRFQPGDEVFGDNVGHWGGFAEYVCVRENALLPKPAAMTFEEAAAVPHAALLALQGLRDKGRVQPGQNVLINGAGGGAGTFAIQIAKSFGAEVTGVDSTEKLDVMRSVGADQVIDYTQVDFTRNGQRYDFILDIAAHHSVFDHKRALSPAGTYVVVGGSTPRIMQVIFLGPLISMGSGSKLCLLAHKPNKGLADMIEFLEAGRVVPVIDRRYPLSEVPEALRYFGEGHARGKVVITV